MNKKLLGVLGVAALLLAGNFAWQEVKEVDAAGDYENVKTLFEKYYNDGVYTKNTIINIKDEVKEELRVHFHAGVNSLERTTYYDGDELWMAEANSGYGTNGSNMTHFSKDSNGKNIVDYTVEGTTMEEYYVTLDDFVQGTHNSVHSNNETLDLTAGWSTNGTIYTSTNTDVLDAFRLFTAPLWIGKTQETSNYLNYTKATVQEYGTSLVMSLYVSGTNSGAVKGTENDSETDVLFSQATIYRGVYSINIGSENYRIDLNDDSTNEWALAEYMLLGTSVKAGDTFALLKNGFEKMDINQYEGNLVNGTFTNNNEKSDIYVKFYDGAIDIYASTPEIDAQIARIYFTMPGWSGSYQAPSLYYWGGQSVDWNATSNSSNMTLSSGKGGWNSTYYIDIDLTKGNLTGIIVKFKQNGTVKQSNDITSNLPTSAGEYVITAGYSSWSGDTWKGATIAAK